MKVLGKIIVTILALLFTGSTFFILIGSTQMNSNDVLPVIGINTLITIICIWLYIKFNKKNELYPIDLRCSKRFKSVAVLTKSETSKFKSKVWNFCLLK